MPADLVLVQIAAVDPIAAVDLIAVVDPIVVVDPIAAVDPIVVVDPIVAADPIVVVDPIVTADLNAKVRYAVRNAANEVRIAPAVQPDPDAMASPPVDRRRVQISASLILVTDCLTAGDDGGRDGSIRSRRSRERFTASSSPCGTGRTTLAGGLSGVSGERTEGDPSLAGGRAVGCRSSTEFVGEAGVVTLLNGFVDSPSGFELSVVFGSAASRTTRGGRVTAPVGLVSGVPSVEVSDGMVTLGSRPLNTLERRNSSSSGAPGVRTAAPVIRSGRSDVVVVRGGRAIAGRSGRSLAVVPSRPEPIRAGSPPLTGSEFKARRASASSARSGRITSPPIVRAGIAVTALR